MEHQTNSCFTDYSCKDFITVLSGKAPVPGGGGASALAGAIGIALGNMVGSLTVGKKTYAAVEEDIIQCKKKADDITARLLDLVEKDAEAFEPLSAAYGMPKSTPEEIEKKAEVMEAALVGACEVPLEIMRTCAEAIDLIETFAEKGSKIAISDAGVGATLLNLLFRGHPYISTSTQNPWLTKKLPLPIIRKLMNCVKNTNRRLTRFSIGSAQKSDKHGLYIFSNNLCAKIKTEIQTCKNGGTNG